jgi:hypothetical protein
MSETTAVKYHKTVDTENARQQVQKSVDVQQLSKMKAKTSKKQTGPTESEIAQWDALAKQSIGKDTVAEDFLLTYMSISTLGKQSCYHSVVSMFFFVMKVFDYNPCQAVFGEGKEVTTLNPKEVDIQFSFKDALKAPVCPRISDFFTGVVNNSHKELILLWEKMRQYLEEKYSHGGGFIENPMDKTKQIRIVFVELPKMPTAIHLLDCFKFVRKCLWVLWWSHPLSHVWDKGVCNEVVLKMTYLLTTEHPRRKWKET